MKTSPQPPPKRVLIIAPQRATLQDVTGPWEVFCRANEKAGGRAYAVLVAASALERRIATKYGLELGCDLTLAEAEGVFDTVLTAGAAASPEPDNDPALAAWLAKAAPSVRRMGSICTGAFHLAEAGLLDGRRAATHWAHCARLAERFPAVTVDPEPIYVRDGSLYTSAGITAGIDLALALVEEDLGPALAHAVARELVVFLKRPADQRQISASLSHQASDRASIRELLAWLPDHLDAALGAEALAASVGMSLRTFARAFRKETGTTPGAHVAALRLEAARRRLTETEAGLETIARQAGFGSLRTMDRQFHKTLGRTAARYRAEAQSGSQGDRDD